MFFILSTGLDMIDAFPFFGMSYSTFKKRYSVYSQAMRFFFQATMIVPTDEEMKRATPPSMQVGEDELPVRYILDAHECKCQCPGDLRVATSFWSPYKHAYTIKCQGYCTACGYMMPNAIYGEDNDWLEPRPGRCSDDVGTEACGIFSRIGPGWKELADKGYTCHHQWALREATLETPWHREKNAPTFQLESTRQTQRVARPIIHIERAFNRIQHFKILHVLVKISQMDRFSTTFFLCCMLQNFDVISIRK